MKRRIFSLLLALCLIVGLLPAVAIPHAHAAVTTATVTLFGVSTTIDLDETTTDIPEAYYWVDDGTNIPAAATEDQIAEGTWNYSFAIIDDIPTVTLRNADYKYNASFLYGKYDGKLKVAYEGTNSVFVPYSSSATRYFISFSASTNGPSSARQIYITGADDAVLNVTGGDNSASIIGLSNKVYLNITGGTLNVQKTNNGGVSAVIGAGYSKTIIKNCNLTVKDNTTVAGRYPTVTLGYSSASYGATIEDSTVYVESTAHTGICVGIYQSNGNGVLYPAPLTISGNSNVKVVNKANSTVDKPYNGVGIYATQLTVNGGTLEIEAAKKAFHGTSKAAPILTSYSGVYNMFTATGDDAATEYADSTYFKVAPCDHSAVEGVEEITKNPTCTEVGSKNVTYTCAYGHTWTETAEIPATGHTEGETRPEIATDEFVTYCAVCGEKISSEAATKLETAYSMVIDGTTRTITAYDIPLYLINKTSTGYYRVTKTVETTDPETGEVTTSSVTENVAGDYITQTSTGADASNYNAKLIWHTGDEGPTLYLRDFKLDHYNEELGGKWRMSSSTSTAERTTAGIHTGTTAPLKIVVESGECVIQNYEGIHYQNDLTIESADDASLSVFTVRTGILPTNVGSGYANEATHLSGYKLTLDANLTVSLGSFANSANGGYVIRTIGADMIINGGNIVADYRGAAKSVCGIGVVTSGNLRINGGTIYAETYNTANLSGAAYMVADDIYITGGKVIAYAQHQSGMRADNIYISGGELDLDVHYGGLVVKANTGVISITGGVIKATNKAKTEYIFAYNYLDGEGTTAQDRKIPEFGANVAITAGADEETAQKITNLSSFNYNVRYIKVEFVDAPACEHTNTTTNEEIITDATCTVAGSKKVTVTCECGEVISEEIVEIAAKGHTEKTDVETKAATCTEAGYTKTTVICTVCGETISETTETIDALGHTEKTDVETKAATCTEAGYTKTTVTCTVCGETISETTEEIKALGHTAAEAVKENVVAADCDDAGSYDMVVYCSVCKAEISRETFTVDAVGHTEETLPGKDATCTETGLTEGKKCTVCGITTVEQTVIDALGHTEKTDVETKAATCTEAGYTKTTVTCTVCGETISETTEEIKALGHTEKTDVETKAATCTEAGYTKTTVTCSVCGEKISETTETIDALGHTEVTTTETKEATCGAAGYTKTIVTCSVCGEKISETVEEIPATGNHVFDDANDTTCNNCGYVRGVEITFEVNENNKLVLVDPNADHIYHRVIVYFLGDNTVKDIELTNPLKELDPNAKTYWGINDINKVVLTNSGNYVLHLLYNTAGSPKILRALEVTVEANASVPTLNVENGKLVVTDESGININHRATVYYLGAETVSNPYNVDALKAMDPTAKTTWTLKDINNVYFAKSGNYAVVLDYNTPGSRKLTVAKTFTVVVSKPTISRDGYKLKVTDNDATHKNHRATIYFVGSDTVADIYDEAALKAINPTAKTYWGLSKINKMEMAKPGTYVIYLSYNLASGVKQTVVVKTNIKLPVPAIWLEESGQIGTYVPTEVAHRNYVIYYLGNQTVEDIYDIDALNAIDANPLKFESQKQVRERGLLTEKGNYVLVVYYNYAGSSKQVIAEFATLK